MNIIDIENEFGIKFPHDYHTLSIPNEGGCMIALKNVWYIPGAEDLSYYIKEARDSDGFPSNGVVIAYDGCGNYLFLLEKRVSSDVEPDIYLHDHETLEIIKIGSRPSDVMKEIHPKDKFNELLGTITDF